MASPASLVGSGSFAISMRSVSTPAHLPSSPVTRRAACRLIRPILAVPSITYRLPSSFSKREIRIAGRGDSFYEQRKRWLGHHTKKAHTQHMFQVLTTGLIYLASEGFAR